MPYLEISFLWCKFTNPEFEALPSVGGMQTGRIGAEFDNKWHLSGLLAAMAPPLLDFLRARGAPYTSMIPKIAVAGS